MKYYRVSTILTGIVIILILAVINKSNLEKVSIAIFSWITSSAIVLYVYDKFIVKR